MIAESPSQLSQSDQASARSGDVSGVVKCAHCTLPVPAGLIDPDADAQFCCHACRTVYEMLHSCGLTQYYSLRDRIESDAAPARSTGRNYAEFDDPSFASLYVRDAGVNAKRTELFLEGVHCVACVWLIEKLPELVPGVLDARLDMGRALVRLVWNPQQVNLSTIAVQLDRFGYASHAAHGPGARAARAREDRQFLIRLAVAGALAGNSMLLAWSLYSGHFTGIDPEFKALFRYLSMGFAILALVWPGRVFLVGAWRALKTHSRNLDLPIALALSAATVTSVVNTFAGSDTDIYFDSITILIFMLLAGRWIQHRQQRAATDSVELLYALTPTHAHLWEDGSTREVPVATLAPGVIVQVRAEETIPADGVIVQGQTNVDVSILTGESAPVSLAQGSQVHAGSVNLSEPVLVRVEATGSQTRLGRLMQLVEENALRRVPIVCAADRLAGWFVLGVVVLACLTLGIWLMIEPSVALSRALALLVVTCPCALGLATPLAVTVGIGKAARRGIMIKGGQVLEAMKTPGTMVLDKTGTLTVGRLELLDWTGDETIKTKVAALEAGSSHPAARALADSLTSAQQTDSTASHIVSEMTQHPGRGIEGRVDGSWLVVGSVSFVLEKTPGGLPDWADEAIDKVLAKAHSPILVACDGRIVAVAGLGDALRDDARASVDALKRDGWKVMIVSGDAVDVVRAVGASLGIAADACIGAALPEDKVRFVEAELERAEQHNAPVVMVGDGVNDAAALALATVGVAVHGGAQASLAAADVYMQRAGVSPIVELCCASRRMVRSIHVNLGVSLAYNVVAASLAMAGLIGPLAAAILMPLSSLSVVGLALRAKSFGDAPCR